MCVGGGGGVEGEGTEKKRKRKKWKKNVYCGSVTRKTRRTEEEEFSAEATDCSKQLEISGHVIGQHAGGRQ